ncbi:QacE family quaternary ammonium compound efflux SMR transporter [Virgibacillus profundi]|uniref:QacE family quaternary ammonium compound efflux SMR transporter n=1 Tax=Virgibacillus profundi TaxID=2024555 RepID=A0A2A2IJX2_9BACI|nr:multidrug efflux SMR transporter [Virgibacillus profundi]PAV31405.1 QacE family quaternary ammonium compound efflux SMR transporter [Virgibacillus profundi]PXY55591.1 QacE family quaternary ammonium compound efflux SMR transporter [Virgibacillus profundi]
MNKNWIKLFVAAFLEVFWVIGLAHAYDFWTWTATVILIILSNYLMITVAQVLPAGTVYAVFVGLGAGGTVIAEILFFGEPFRWAKIFLIAVLLSGVIGLKLVTDNESDEVEEGGRS